MTTIDLEMKRTTCWCGTPFMLPARLLEAAQNCNHTIFCPHGHSLTWKETETDRLRRERDRLKQHAAMLEGDILTQKTRADNAEAATRRLKKRMSAGTCPCCQRTFSNMSRHMKTKHPEFIAENVVKLDKRA